MALLDMKPNELEPYWVPFTANRAFKKRPAPVRRRQGHALFQARRQPRSSTPPPASSASMPATAASRSSRPSRRWRPSSTTRPAFQYGHPKVFELASRLSLLAPGDLDYAFFSNSGLEAVDTALKIALAYHKAKGEGARIAPDRPRARLSRHRLRRHLGRRHRPPTASSSATC